MALQQLKDRYSYAGNLWFKDNPEAFFVPFPDSGYPEIEAASIRAALNERWNDIEQVVAQQRGAVMLIDQDTNIKNSDLELDYQGKEILVGNSIGTFVPPDILYGYALSRDDMRRVSIKHIDLEEFRNHPELWRDLCDPDDYEAPHCHFMLVQDKKPVAAFLGNYFWFDPGIQVSQDRSVVFQEPLDFAAARQRKESLLHYFPVLEDYMDKRKYSGRAMNERDHALLDYAPGMLRASAVKGDIEQAVSGLEIDLNMYVPERENVAGKLPLLLTDQSDPAPLRLPAPESKTLGSSFRQKDRPGTLQGEFEAVVNAKGYVRLPSEWRDLVDRDYVSLFNQGTGQLVCFNENVLDDDVVEVIRNSEISNHLFAFMQSPVKNKDGRTKIDKEAQKTFREALNIGSSAKIPVKLTGCSNYFTVEVAGLSDPSKDSKIGKWRRLDVSIAQFTKALDSKARSSGPEQSR